MVRVVLEFSGGVELLFGNQKTVEADIPQNGGQLTVAEAMAWARDNLLTERPELFMKGSSVRPGVLVLVNDTDWELCGELEAAVTDGDRLTFISTLHGG
ncbi:hypothetical protein CHLNCDRAFT_145261 [Chlorella variabilis]|uniref:Ubiquitin-related modifier 1 homolog n=1 Tax=Chlorella variabilis TaxID=554065 RepID=E1ZE18_CHLVA|nr:hypothetical protein CHLNCDRAFT_145261 [Chlorella variabilis]EFN55792.1 hypothetical protein CHLNCDRAFT_145261 [Chlorella variabilis]|eukprot:XP_005847894.1 hypothetical protein CHLNCDRAFT_145261 [Chlorella variabilis]